MGIKKKISENSFFYKLYLYYNLYIRQNALKKRLTYSQNQEDLFINNYFKDKNKGFYLDIGCYHPIMYSNTALLYNRGWEGTNIDMNQTSIDLFNILRKKDKNICVAISNTQQETTQYFDHAFSPINTLDKNFSDIAEKAISFNHHTKKKLIHINLNKLLRCITLIQVKLILLILMLRLMTLRFWKGWIYLYLMLK